jgi:HEAT repeat protein
MQSLVKLVGPDALGTILRISKNLSLWTAIELSVVVSGFKGTAVPFLIEALRSRDQSVVLFATEMLAEIGLVTAVEPLMHLIRTTIDTTIQAQSLKTLGRLGDERARNLVVELLKSKVQPVRLSAMEALGKISGSEAVEMLKPWLASRLQEEKLVAARALATTGVEGIAVLRAAGAHSDELSAAIADQVLEEFGVEREEA